MCHRKTSGDVIFLDFLLQALSKIVRRDFFPDISKLEAQLEFIEATESNDYEKLRLISERFATTNRTPVPGGKRFDLQFAQYFIALNAFYPLVQLPLLQPSRPR